MPLQHFVLSFLLLSFQALKLHANPWRPFPGARVLIDSALWISEPRRAACLLRLFSWLQMLNTRISAIPQSAMKRNVVSIVFGRLWVSSMFRCILHLPTSTDSYEFAPLPTIVECFISAFLSREFFQHKRFSAGLQTPFRLKGTDLLCEQNFSHPPSPQ